MFRLRIGGAVALMVVTVGPAAGDDPDRATRAGVRIGEAAVEAARTAVLQARIDRLTDENRRLADELAATRHELTKARAVLKELTGLVEATDKLQANLKATLDELDAVRKRNKAAADQRQELAVELQKARAEQRAAELEARRLQAQLDEMQRKANLLASRLEALESEKGPKSPPAVPAGIRGKVTVVKAELAQLDIGLDAGLAPGAVLDAYRIGGGSPRYLGTVEVVNVTPKAAAVRFRPAGGRPLDKLKPEELLQPGDEVGRAGR